MAPWFIEREIPADHSAVYRAYLNADRKVNAVLKEMRNPDGDWSNADQPE